MKDRIEKMGDSIIQHGKLNDRIYLMKLHPEDCPAIIGELDKLAAENDYTKIFVKVPFHESREFARTGYETEAAIPGYYDGGDKAFFMSKFFDEERKRENRRAKLHEVLNNAKRKKNGTSPATAYNNYIYRACTENDAPAIAGLYGDVFETYPFPIQDPDFIRNMMNGNVVYYGAWRERELGGASSAEIEEAYSVVEMTDFAVNPKHRGQGISAVLLETMEQEMRKRGIKTAYTIARSFSHGMNATFARLNYIYAGTLINNTNICGNIESMNVWYKNLKS